MITLSNLSPERLRQAADLLENIQKLQAELDRCVGEASAGALVVPAAPAKVGRLSPQGLANIRAGVVKRVTKQRGAAPAGKAARPHKRNMTPEGRRRLAESARLRWEKAHAEGRSRL